MQNFTYSYDNLGNLLCRSDGNQNLAESFTYDNRNRLGASKVSTTCAGAGTTTTYAYDDIGNMTSRSDLSPVSGYTYPASGAGSVRPHAVSRVDFAANSPWPSQYRTYSYDANGNISGETQFNASNQQVYGPGRVATFTSFNAPSVIYNDATSQVRLELSNYGPEHQRLTSTVVNSTGTRTTVYLNPDNAGGLFYEKETKASGVIEQRNYITAYGQAVAIVKLTGGAWSTVYLHRDNLGSTTAITDASGAVIERLAYEPFGNRRFANGVTDPNNAIVAQNTNRGFTNHEHFDELDLVHMNGRIYDPTLGRFMSPDPQIQDPYNLQSYNRYSYVLNNPLFYTDPTGYNWLTKAWKKVWHSTVGRIAVVATVAWFTAGLASDWYLASNGITAASASACGYASTSAMAASWGSGIGGISLATVSSVVGGTAGGFSAGFVGSNGDLSAGLQGAVAGAVFGGISGAYNNQWTWSRVAANSLTGGTLSYLGGGTFRRGFEFALVSSLAMKGWNYTREVTDAQKLAACSAPGSSDVCERNQWGELRKDGARGIDWDTANPSGARAFLSNEGVGMEAEGSGQHWYDPGHLFENKYIARFINEVASPHDFINSVDYNSNGLYVSRGILFDNAFQLYSFSGMVPAGIATAVANSANIPYDNLYRRRDN